MNRMRAIGFLTLFYLGITSNLEWQNILFGIFLAFIITLLIKLDQHTISWKQAPQTIFALTKYILVLMYDLIRSGFQVAWIVLNPRLRLKSGVVAIPTECQSDMGMALNAHAITLTPGELVVEMSEDGVLYTHCLDATHSETLIQDSQELREDLLKDIFN